MAIVFPSGDQARSPRRVAARLVQRPSGGATKTPPVPPAAPRPPAPGAPPPRPPPNPPPASAPAAARPAHQGEPAAARDARRALALGSAREALGLAGRTVGGDAHAPEVEVSGPVGREDDRAPVLRPYGIAVPAKPTGDPRPARARRELHEEVALGGDGQATVGGERRGARGAEGRGVGGGGLEEKGDGNCEMHGGLRTRNCNRE